MHNYLFLPYHFVRMHDALRRWRGLFLFCLGLFAASLFVMQWLEADFWSGDERFSIVGLQLFYSKRDVLAVLTEMKQPTRIALNYDLVVRFVFMTGFYPAIACACMMTRETARRTATKNILFALAMLQPVAWVFDIAANFLVMGWIDKPEIGNEFRTCHNLVVVKWSIALAGIFVPLIAVFSRTGRRQHRA